MCRIYLVTMLCCAPGRSRTRNLLIRSQPLYPVELQAHTLSVIVTSTLRGAVILPKFMQENDLKIPKEVTQITNRLYDAGFEGYLVGGCVRDLLLGRDPKDWDIATNAKPEKTTELFDHTHYDNEFGTVRVVNDTEKPELKTVEITTYRTESAYSDNRHPDEVAFSNNIDEDLSRRDFTINALALDLEKVSRDNKVVVSSETLIDNYSGLVDLQKGRLRAVGDPEERFKEDALRIMRGIRFAAELSLIIEKPTKKAMESQVSRLGDIAIERIREEFEKIICSKSPRIGLEIARKLGVLNIFLPELSATVGIEQNEAHSYDLWEHLTRALQATADKDWPEHIRLAALFHDIAKVETREWDDEREDWTFHNHEVVGSRVTKNVLERMKFSNKMVAQVTNLVRWHMFFSDTEEITLSAVRRLVRNVGKENIWDLMKLRRADRIGMGRPKEEPYRLRKYQSMIEEVIRDPISVEMLEVNGDDVMHETNESPGPRIGHILHALLEEVLEDPERNKKDELLKRAKKLSKLDEKKLEKLGKKARKEKESREDKKVGEIREKYGVD